jgi:hypothetical protein
MKKHIVALLSFTALSCGVSSPKITDKKVLYEVLTQQSNGGANIRFFEILSEPKELKMLQNDQNLRKKISPNDIQNSNFVILNMGEKATGGYSIGVDSVLETDNNIIITVKDNNPKPGDMVTQVITYPFCVVKINSKKDIVIK